MTTSLMGDNKHISACDCHPLGDATFFPRLGLPDESSEGEVSSHADGRCPQNFWFLATYGKAEVQHVYTCLLHMGFS